MAPFQVWSARNSQRKLSQIHAIISASELPSLIEVTHGRPTWVSASFQMFSMVNSSTSRIRVVGIPDSSPIVSSISISNKPRPKLSCEVVSSRNANSNSSMSKSMETPSSVEPPTMRPMVVLFSMRTRSSISVASWGKSDRSVPTVALSSGIRKSTSSGTVRESWKAPASKIPTKSSWAASLTVTITASSFTVVRSTGAPFSWFASRDSVKKS